MTDLTVTDFMIAALLGAIAAFGILHSRAMMNRRIF
jgi:hypothetical protein